MDCYLTNTGSYLPGPAIDNDHISDYLGELDGEQEVKQQVLRMNGIRHRHYAQNTSQTATGDVYDLATAAALNCLESFTDSRLCLKRGLPLSEQDTNSSKADCDLEGQLPFQTEPCSPTFLSAGTTYAPLAGPGIASRLHHHLAACGRMKHSVEISSHSGICTSSAAAIIGATRAIQVGAHKCALAVGAEHASEVLKSTVIRPVDDRYQHDNLRKSKWFMSVFLRFMLSDGAGAFLFQDKPTPSGLSFRVDWTCSESFASQAPLCMKLDNATGLLSQDIDVLSRYMFSLGSRFFSSALKTNHESLSRYRMILPHMSSYFFQRKMERVISEHSSNRESPVPYWTNLAEAGNTGAASIFVMLDQFLRTHTITSGDRILLFVPESGQFNYVLISLTAVTL